MHTGTIYLSPFNTFISDKFGNENVVVTINWSQNYTSVISSIIEVEVTVFPYIKVNIMTFQSVQLTVNYNTQYTVNVTKLLCGQNVTETIELYYGM